MTIKEEAIKRCLSQQLVAVHSSGRKHQSRLHVGVVVSVEENALLLVYPHSDRFQALPFATIQRIDLLGIPTVAA